MTTIGPVQTAALFRPLQEQLLVLLRSLPHDAWAAQTSAPDWQVRDVVAHLLDTELRRIGIDRDGHAPPAPGQPIDGHASLVDYLNTLNAEWVLAARRISPQLLIELLEVTGPHLATLMERADPQADATYPVTWTGQDRSPMWLDVAREYTERWHHQDQIRDAVGAPPLDADEWLRPTLDVSMLALPPAYAATDAPAGTTIVLRATGPVVAAWRLSRAGSAWRVEHASTEAAPDGASAEAVPDGASAEAASDGASPACVMTAPALALARLLLHRFRDDVNAAQLRVEGDSRLAEPLFRARAVMV